MHNKPVECEEQPCDFFPRAKKSKLDQGLPLLQIQSSSGFGDKLKNSENLSLLRNWCGDRHVVCPRIFYAISGSTHNESLEQVLEC